MSNSNRYNLQLDVTEMEINPMDPLKKNLSNLTPKAIPYRGEET